MGIAFENGYEYGYRFLKPVPDCVYDLLVKGDQNTVESKNICLPWKLQVYSVYLYRNKKLIFLTFLTFVSSSDMNFSSVA